MAFIESIENLPLAGDSFDQIFLSPIMLSLIVRKAEGCGGERGEQRGWEGCVSATLQLTSRWLWRLWFSGRPAYLPHDVIRIEPAGRRSGREAGEAAAPASQPQEALRVRRSAPGWARRSPCSARPAAAPAAPGAPRAGLSGPGWAAGGAAGRPGWADRTCPPCFEKEDFSLFLSLPAQLSANVSLPGSLAPWAAHG